MDLKNKVAIVTGVSRGIGKATVEALLEKGAKVAGWGRSKPEYEHKNFKFYKVDVGVLTQVQKVYQETCKDFGENISVLINNAGVGYFKFLENLSEEEWKKMFDVNVHGIFNTCKTILPQMRAKKFGHIINISSIAGLIGIPEGTGYCATKFAVKAISEALFKEVRKYNIKVSCIYPGSVNTDFFENYPSIDANETMLHPKEVGDTLIQILETSDNFFTANVEIRPMHPDYKGVK